MLQQTKPPTDKMNIACSHRAPEPLENANQPVPIAVTKLRTHNTMSALILIGAPRAAPHDVPNVVRVLTPFQPKRG
jgi:hypothetical protein